MTLHPSQLDFFAIDGHVKNPGSTIYIHFEDTNLSKYTQILWFEQEVGMHIILFHIPLGWMLLFKKAIVLL
jgi:hypothetical protein